MSDGTIVAVSDVHLDQWQSQEPSTYEAKCNAFLRFLDWVSDGSDTGHFVIVGDLLDIPPTGNGADAQLLVRIGSRVRAMVDRGVTVHYLSGNHDIGLAGVAFSFPGIPVEIASRTVLQSGPSGVAFEHGHLLDAWLWEFAQRHAARRDTYLPEVTTAWFHSEGPLPEVADAVNAYLHGTLVDALQWRPMTTGFTAEEQRWGIRVMSSLLDDGFADVAGQGANPPCQEEIWASIGRLGLRKEDLQGEGPLPEAASELFWLLGKCYYSPLPWRRAACRRLAALRQQQPQLGGLVMGHTHAADCFDWQDGDQPLHYANCGTWLGESGSCVVVRDGEITVHRRSWADWLP
ncbi:MAG: hypothetical protein HPY69_10595 [Armatimonadetes bacterium]|nr:hypothetical protein [Armatimonadota bacterium]